MSIDTVASFASDVREGVVKEWHSRTTYGKLWFPIWLLYSVCIWAVLLTVVGIVVAFEAYAAMLESSEPMIETHKDE